MTIENYPVWPFEPNWTSSVTETLEWLTDVLTSPTGSEQRRSMRFFPRRSMDFTIAAEGAERRFLDNLLMSYSADDWYLPIWYDVTITTGASSGAVIPCSPSPGITAGTIVFIPGSTVFNYQVGEVESVDEDGITLVDAPTSAVPAGSRIFPMTVARLREMPGMTAISSALITAEPQFLVTEKPVDPGVTTLQVNEAAGLLEIYRNFHVLTLESNWTDRTERTHTRMLDVFDNEINAPLQIDTAGRPFPSQRHAWALETYAEHARFYALMQALRGRATPVWVPTWMDDFTLVAPTTVSGYTITSSLSGYTRSGGVRPERQDVMIETTDGRRFYRRLTDSAISGGNEVLFIDEPIGEVILPTAILRVCFMSLMRLDHDSIEITHLTDMDGLSEVQVTFRAAPDTRVPEAAF